MSEITPDDPRGGPRHVESKVVSDDAPLEAEPPQLEAPVAPDAEPAPAEDPMVPSGDELVAAKYYAIAFLVVVIPLGLLLLTLLIIAFVKSLDFLK